jgi:hypothetical protein
MHVSPVTMGAFDEQQRRLLRAGFALLAITPAWIGIWGTAAPHSFYRGFPGAGHHWVSALGPYSEHLVRDYTSANLGFLALLVFAAIVLERRLVQGALIAYVVAGVPHLVYHLTTTKHFSTSDNLGSLGGLALIVVLPLAMLSVTRSRVRYSGEAV